MLGLPLCGLLVVHLGAIPRGHVPPIPILVPPDCSLGDARFSAVRFFEEEVVTGRFRLFIVFAAAAAAAATAPLRAAFVLVGVAVRGSTERNPN